MIIDIEEHIFDSDDILYVSPIYTYNKNHENYHRLKFLVTFKNNDKESVEITIGIPDFIERFKTAADVKGKINIITKMMDLSMAKLKMDLVDQWVFSKKFPSTQIIPIKSFRLECEDIENKKEPTEPKSIAEIAAN